jgi:hypothetical protein
MALVTRSTSASVETITGASAVRLPNLPDLIAGEALDACAPCYIKSSDGKVWMSNATAANEAAEVVGFTGTAYVVGEPVTLYPPGVVFYYGDDFSGASITPGDVLYTGATAGRLDTAATAGDPEGVAVVLDDNHIVFERRRMANDVAQAALVVSGTTGTAEIRLTDNLADALSIEEGSNDYLVFVTTNGSESVTVGQNLTMADGKNVVLNTTTGTKIGTATAQKLGFYNATPVVQPTAYTQTYATADKTHANPTAATLSMADGAGTNDNTIGAVTGDASVIAAFQEVVDEINKLVADVADVKQAVNALIDDLQALGLVG